ncbi:MAG: thymidine phosphorylase, partial [Nanoarchaeota archaeon]|nr:thymidine phosphorylase [Nanoarchaeota archaeon]
MELRVKTSKWSAGLPVVMLREDTAEEMGVHAKERLSIRTLSKKPLEVSAILDIVDRDLGKSEMAVSTELKKRLGLRSGDKVEVNLATPPESLKFIKEKLKGKRLSPKKIEEIVVDIVENKLSEAEIALFISATYEKGMNFKETVDFIKSILNTGKSLSLKEKCIADKHCIGGVAGNRTTPLVVSICAAGGVVMPKSSSRAITSAAGTADVMETVAKVDFSIEEVKKIIKKTKACLVWGGGLGMVPADSKIINVEKEIRIDTPSLMLASIMSKKLAAGSKNLLIDIPYGEGAKTNKQNALKLKKQFEKLGKHFKIKIKVILTNGSQPIGNGVGPALEMLDIISVLDPEKQGPRDLEQKSLILAGEIFEMISPSKKINGYEKAKEILYSGEAFKKFKEIVRAQKGKINGIDNFKFKKTIFSDKEGKVKKISNKDINTLARVAGCPIDRHSGIYLHRHVGDKVRKGEKIITIYAESKPRLDSALKFYRKQNP